MLELIKNLNNILTIEQQMTEHKKNGVYYGGVPYTKLKSIELLENNWWDFIKEDDEIGLVWIISDDPIKKENDIWEVKNRDTGKWQKVCFTYEIIDICGHRYQYDPAKGEMVQVWQGTCYEYWPMITALNDACNHIWQYMPCEDCKELVDAICVFIEKHKKWLSKKDGFEYDDYFNYDNYRHAGECIDYWSQKSGIEIENPTGYHVVRGDKKELKNPRHELPKTKRRGGNSHKLPTKEI